MVRMSLPLVLWASSALVSYGRRIKAEEDVAVIATTSCRRRRCPGAGPAPPPQDANGEPKQCDKSDPPTNVPAQIAQEYSGLHYVGQGANACVYLADEPPMAIKVSKWPSKPTLWSPRKECEQAQTLHRAACGDDEAIAAADMYLPTCVGGHRFHQPGDDAWILMHRAGGDAPTSILRLGEGRAHKLPVEYQKIVFAQLVGAIRIIHKLGYTHNDLHDGNVMLDLPEFLRGYPWDRSEDTPDPADADSLPRLSIIDFGEMVPYAEGWKKDYKRDANSLWDRTAFLANCQNHRARWWATRGSQEGAEIFVGCLKTNWDIDADFERALWTVLEASIAEADEQHIEQLYNTNFIQSHLPETVSLYPADACGDSSLLERLTSEEEKQNLTAH